MYIYKTHCVCVCMCVCVYIYIYMYMYIYIYIYIYLETSRMGAPYIYDISRIRVKVLSNILYSTFVPLDLFLISVKFFALHRTKCAQELQTIGVLVSPNFSHRQEYIITSSEIILSWYKYHFVPAQILYIYIYIYIYIYTGCPRRNVPDFGRVFLILSIPI